MAAAFILMVPAFVLAVHAAIWVQEWGRTYRLDRLREEDDRKNRAAWEAWQRDGGGREEGAS